MARKLSAIAKRAFYLTIVGFCCSPPAPTARAQSELRFSSQPAIVENPYVQSAVPSQPAPAAATVQQAPFAPQHLPPAQPQSAPAVRASRRIPAAYQNPFASAPSLPPFSIPLRPSPISRWRRTAAAVEQPSLVSTAILSVIPEPLATIPRAGQGSDGSLNWEQLPTAQRTPASRGVASTAKVMPKHVPMPLPPDPVAFAPSPLVQPIWMVPQLAGDRATGGAQLTTSETPRAAPWLTPGQEANQLPPPVGEPIVIELPEVDGPGELSLSPAPAEGPDGLVLSLPPILEAVPMRNEVDTTTPEMLSVIVSDYVETADGWLAEAEEVAQRAETMDEFLSVVELCQQGLRSQPDEAAASALNRLAAWAYNRRGEWLADRLQTADAVAEFERAVQLDAECSLAIHNRAVSLAQQDRSDEALRDFNRVIELNPGLGVAYRNRAELLASLGRLEEALRDYDLALEQLNQDVVLYRSRADALERLGKLAEAINDLNQAIRLDPEDAVNFCQRASVAKQLGDYNQSLRDLDRAIQLNPDFAEAHRNRAWLLATCPEERYRNPRQAVASAAQALKISGADARSLDAQAAALAGMGEFPAAVEALRQALAAAPSEYAPSLQARLSLYEQGRPFIEPFDSAIRSVSHEERPSESGDAARRRR